MTSPDASGAAVVVIDDELLIRKSLTKVLKAKGYRVAFSSGGATSFDEAQLKRRLQAIKDAGLGWKDFWVPGKP